MGNKKQEETVPKECNVFWCAEHPSKEMTHEKMLEHLQEAHGFKVKGLKASKRMLSHMDGREWFSYEYEIVIEQGKKKVVLQNYMVGHRDENDMMRWA